MGTEQPKGVECHVSIIFWSTGPKNFTKMNFTCFFLLFLARPLEDLEFYLRLTLCFWWSRQ